MVSDIETCFQINSFMTPITRAMLQHPQNFFWQNIYSTYAHMVQQTATKFCKLFQTRQENFFTGLTMPPGHAKLFCDTHEQVC